MGRVKQCFSCKQEFRVEELIDYCSVNAKKLHSYCKNCYKKKVALDNFISEICKFFGIKAPGPRIWTERKRIQTTYGYSDETIISCLYYLRDIEKRKIVSESLYLVNPINVDRMVQWRKTKISEAQNIMNAANMETRDFIVPIKEKKNESKFQVLNADDFLEEE